MKTKINRAKTFVQNHRCKIVGAAGIAVGVVIGQKLPVMEKSLVVLDLTVDQAKRLIDNPSDYIQYDAPRSTIMLVMKSEA